MKRYWSRRDEINLKKAETFEDLRNIALNVLKRMPNPISMVAGPITSGGRGSIRKNIQEFKRNIRELGSRGIIVFNQMIFEEPMHRIMKTDYYKEGNHLLETFYLPIFESGLIKNIYFISGWETSFGANWEHNQALRLGINIIYL